MRDRIEANCLPRGILYPWWVPVISFGGQLACVVMALFLRDALWTPDLLILTIPLVLVAPVVQLGFGRWLPWWLDSLPALVAAAWLISVAPDLGTAPIDAAPGLLAFVVAEITARDGLRPGIAVGAIAYGILGAGALFGPGVVGFLVHAILLEIGFVVGAMLLWQMRALVAERQRRDATWQQATTAERQRIAREIHDLVAHSLSVTLLHITGARHALRDVGDRCASADDAVGEADAALRRRRAGRPPGDGRHPAHREPHGGRARPSPQSLPGAATSPPWCGSSTSAGLHVEYDDRGDLAQLADDHRPRPLPDRPGVAGQRRQARARLHRAGSSLTVDSRRAPGSLVRNQLDGPRPPDRRGRAPGLAGMHARAAQLGASLQAGAGRRRLARRRGASVSGASSCRAATRLPRARPAAAAAPTGPPRERRRRRADPGRCSSTTRSWCAPGCAASCAAATASRSSPSAPTATRCAAAVRTAPTPTSSSWTCGCATSTASTATRRLAARPGRAAGAGAHHLRRRRAALRRAAGRRRGLPAQGLPGRGPDPRRARRRGRRRAGSTRP